MFVASPLSGWLCDRFGRLTMIGVGALVLTGAVILAGLAPGTERGLIIFALFLNGIGWNFAFVAASALLTDALVPAERASIQGMADLVMGLMGAFGSAAGGMILGVWGFAGTPLDSRRYSNDRLASVVEISKDIAQHMDRLGYDILWSAEHHFQREGYECIPNLSTWGVWLAQHTKRLKFGCAFNVLTMWHPIRLAEDFAVADILTNGRMIFGIGRGYHTREVETFGAPMLDDAANRELFEEQFEIVMKAFHEDAFTHNGKHYTLPPEVPYRGYTLKEITLVPRPIRRPVEVWQPIVSGTPRAFDFMAKHGIKGVMLGTAEQFIDQWIHAYQERSEEHTSELQSRGHLVCRLLLEKKK